MLVRGKNVHLQRCLLLLLHVVAVGGHVHAALHGPEQGGRLLAPGCWSSPQRNSLFLMYFTDKRKTLSRLHTNWYQPAAFFPGRGCHSKTETVLCCQICSILTHLDDLSRGDTYAVKSRATEGKNGSKDHHSYKDFITASVNTKDC